MKNKILPAVGYFLTTTSTGILALTETVPLWLKIGLWVVSGMGATITHFSAVPRRAKPRLELPS